MRLRLTVVSLLAVSGAAGAQTQAQMTANIAAAFRRADVAMTRQWTETMAHMKRLDAENTSRGGGFGYAAALLASQRAWLAFRDAQCVIEGGEFAGGSAQGMATGACRVRLTGQRTGQLKGLEWRR